MSRYFCIKKIINMHKYVHVLHIDFRLIFTNYHRRELRNFNAFFSCANNKKENEIADRTTFFTSKSM